MERRVLLAITLSFLVLFLFQRFVMPPPASAPQPAGATAGQAPGAPGATTGQARVTPGAVPGNASAAPAAVAAPAPVAPVPPAAPAIAATLTEPNAREIVVETTKVRAVFSNRGAKIVHWVLKEYRTDQGEPLDLVPAGAGETAVKPFTLSVEDQALSARLNDAIYRVTVNGAPAGQTVDASAAPQTIVFETASADGLSVKKTFAVEPTSYVVQFGAVVQSGGQRLNPIIHWGPGIGDDIARSPPA